MRGEVAMVMTPNKPQELTSGITPEVAPEVTPCKHHWIIETPNGMFSQGVCKHCKVKKQFRNSSEVSVWMGDNWNDLEQQTGV